MYALFSFFVWIMISKTFVHGSLDDFLRDSGSLTVRVILHGEQRPPLNTISSSSEYFEVSTSKLRNESTFSTEVGGSHFSTSVLIAVFEIKLCGASVISVNLILKVNMNGKENIF
jgi:hypothetical protein